MARLGWMATVGTALMFAPLGTARADTFAVVFNESGATITVSNIKYETSPLDRTATWTWPNFTVKSGSQSWDVTNTGVKCDGGGWVVRATSGRTGFHRDACMQIPWGQIGCVGVVITPDGLRMAQIPATSCSNAWWEQVSTEAYRSLIQLFKATQGGLY